MRWFLLFPCLAMLTLNLAAQETKPDAKSVAPAVGNWEGVLHAGAIELRFGFTIKTNAEGVLSGMMLSIDQGNAEIPITKGSFAKNEVKLSMPKVGATYTATLNEKGDEFTGTFQQGQVKLPLKLKKVVSITVPKRPQEPKPPFPYKAEEVGYENSAAKVKLGGTLTIPEGKGPFPAVLLITGSGQQDRDESLLGHKPFLVLADALTRRGIAVLRVDDRGMGKSTGDFAKSTTYDFADDTQAGVEYLKTRKEINGKRIGLCGHSEGGVIAPIVASKSQEVAFIVLMAGTGLTGEEIINMQGNLIAKSMGVPKKELDRADDLRRKMFALVKAETPSQELVKKLEELYKAETAKLSDQEKKELEKDGGAAAQRAQFVTFAFPWFKTFLIHDPRPVLAQVKCPVLAINGELDLQVPCKENLDAIREALEKAGHKDHTIKSFPKLNHLFQTCTTGTPTEYGKIEETINPEVLKTIGDWILALPTR